MSGGKMHDGDPGDRDGGDGEQVPQRIGNLVVGMAAERQVRFLAVECTRAAALVAQRHGLSAGAAAVAAECLVASTLMSAHIKGEERITVQVQAEHPRFAYASDVDADGGLRARLTPAYVPASQVGQIQGLMLAIKSAPGRELYRGVTPLDGTSVEAGLAHHLDVSAQVDTVLRIQVRPGSAGSLAFVGGLLIERLPVDPKRGGLDEDAFSDRFEPTRASPVDELLLGVAFGKIGVEPAEILENRTLTWRCGCGQERVEGLLRALGRAEIEDMLRDQPEGAEVVCHYCNLAYTVSPERLREISAEMADPSHSPEG